MVSRKLKVSLVIIVAGVLSLGLLNLLPLNVNTTPPIKEPLLLEQNLDEGQQVQTFISIDFGGGRRKVMEIKPDGRESLFNIMKERLSEDGMELRYETYSGLGELITQIDNAKNGTDGKYWQFWVNEDYSRVGASSYIPMAGDMIEWKFTNEQQ